MTYDNTDTDADGTIDAPIDNESVSTGRLGNSTYTIGPNSGNEYQSLSAAMDDLRSQVSRGSEATLWFTGSLSGDGKETSQVEPASHVNVEGNGYTVEVDVAGASAVDGRGKENIEWNNLTIDHAPTTNTSFNAAILIGKQTERDVVFNEVTAIGQSQDDGGYGWRIFDDAVPTLNDCIGIGGAGGDGSHGLSCAFGCDPIINGGVFYGGPEGIDCRGMNWANGSPGGTVCGAVAVAGQQGANCHSIRIKDNADPVLSGCTGRFKQYEQEFTATGTDSEQVTQDTTSAGREFPAATTGVATFLKTIELRILTAQPGASLDIGTSATGTDIASGIDASSEVRIAPDFTPVEFGASDSIHVTPTDSGVEYTVRYHLGVNQFQTYGLSLETAGAATISNCQFLGSPKSAAGVIEQAATDSKRYAIGNSTFHRVFGSEVGRSDNALNGTDDSGATDPIRNCAIFDSISNITPAQE